MGIWIVCLFALIFTGIDFGTSHSNYGDTTKRTELNLFPKDTLTLKMVNDDNIYFRHNLIQTSEAEEVEIDGITMTYASNIKVDVRKSTTNKNYFIVQKESKGKSKSQAKENANEINYNFEIIENTIILDAYFLSEYKNFWKDEEINIIFYVSKDITTFFDNSIKNFLNDVENETDIYDKEMVNHHFIMTNKTLKCTDCVDELEGNEKESI